MTVNVTRVDDRMYPCIDAASTRYAWLMYRLSLSKGAGERDPDGMRRIEAHIRAAATKFGVELR